MVMWTAVAKLPHDVGGSVHIQLVEMREAERLPDEAMQPAVIPDSPAQASAHSPAPAKATALLSARSALSLSASAFSCAWVSALTRFHGSRLNAHHLEGLQGD